MQKEHPGLVPKEPEPQYFLDPTREVERNGSIRHLVAFSLDPGVGVMAGMGIASVHRFFEMKQRGEPEDGFVQPAGSEGGAMGAFVGQCTGRNRNDPRVKEQGGNDEPGACRQQNQRARDRQERQPAAQADQSGPIAAPQQCFQFFPVNLYAGRLRVGDHAYAPPPGTRLLLQPGILFIDLDHCRSVGLERMFQRHPEFPGAFRTVAVGAEGFGDPAKLGVVYGAADGRQALAVHVLANFLVTVIGPDDDRQGQLLLDCRCQFLACHQLFALETSAFRPVRKVRFLACCLTSAYPVYI